ncbi:MAG: NAD(P)H-dependent oxidoreductase [Defluviitaleaceae bacterium]|nr:NAD(P)H-dependent oxidoreductase [Defluviitaleaceae bacterium]
MKILYIYGSVASYDHGLGNLIKRTKAVFEELEAETETIDLAALHPPYYDGDTTGAMDGVFEKIRQASGVVFATTAQVFAPTALMQSFLEYLEHTEYADILKGKHCMLMVLSREGGEKSALDYLTKIVQHFGGYAAAKIGLKAPHLSTLDEGTTGDFADSITEDFYRAVHKNRQYIIPTDYVAGVTAPPPTATEAPAEAPQEAPPTKPEPSKLTPFSDTEEKEIDELSFLFSKKYTKDPILSEGADAFNALTAPKAPPLMTEVPAFVPEGNPFAPMSAPAAAPAKPDTTEIEKLTRDIPKYFQSSLSAGLQAVIQLNISGDEKFDGFLYIHSTECTYTEGTAPAPDITIMADTTIWKEVLSNKTTAQKAFMIGGIKVRGDFVLLTKFDTLFNFPDA